MKVKTSELTGSALDWAVAECEQRGGQAYIRDGKLYEPLCEDFLCYSTDWAQGGPIIERERIAMRYWDCAWEASMVYENDDTDEVFSAEGLGPTPLVAAMRCFVASKLGDEVEVPDEIY